MTTITMPRGFDSAIQTIIQEAREKAVEALAEKYGFDAEEAGRFLAEGGIKVVKMRGPVPKVKKLARTKASKTDKPKRGKTGYLLFSASEREDVQLDLGQELDEDAKLAPQVVVKELAKRWKALEQEEREAWNSQAAALMMEELDDDLGDLLAVRQPSEYGGVPRGCSHVGMCSCGA
jgi:hypothetical protein